MRTQIVSPYTLYTRTHMNGYYITWMWRFTALQDTSPFLVIRSCVHGGFQSEGRLGRWCACAVSCGSAERHMVSCHWQTAWRRYVWKQWWFQTLEKPELRFHHTWTQSMVITSFFFFWIIGILCETLVKLHNFTFTSRTECRNSTTCMYLVSIRKQCFILLPLKCLSFWLKSQTWKVDDCKCTS